MARPIESGRRSTSSGGRYVQRNASVSPYIKYSCAPGCARRSARTASTGRRSEEHTSELQSQSNLVCRLLLEKKKQISLLGTLSKNPKLSTSGRTANSSINHP